MNNYRLSSGAIKSIMDNVAITPAFRDPIVQVLKLNKISNQNQTNSQDRYRIVISDGIHWVQAMLPPLLNDLVITGDISPNVLMKLKEITVNTIQGRTVLIVMKAEVLTQPQQGAIGNPKSLDQANLPAGTQQQETLGNPMQKRIVSAPSPAANPIPPQPVYESGITPINSLNPYQNRWTIKAKVTSKSEIRTWNNQRGGGKLFHVDLIDAGGGEIRATMFGDAVDQFFPIFQVQQTYIISKGSVRAANKKFNPLRNEYELQLDINSQVETSRDNIVTPTKLYDFTKIADLQSKAKDESVDVIGIVQRADNPESFLSKGKELKRRVVEIGDDTQRTIEITFWGAQGENLPLADPHTTLQVIAIKGAKVSTFNTCSLTCSSNSQIEINPQIADYFRLTRWHESQGGNINFYQLSVPNQKYDKGSHGDDSSSSAQKALPLRTVAELKDARPEASAGEDFEILARVTNVKHDNGNNNNNAAPVQIYYNACPGKDAQGKECNKKVVEEMGAQWRCEKCGRTYPTCNPRYILNLAVADHSTNCWVNAFDKEGTKILNKDARSLVGLKDNDPIQYEDVFKNALYKFYRMRIRAKVENYQAPKTRYNILSANVVDWKEQSRALIDIINNSL